MILNNDAIAVGATDDRLPYTASIIVIQYTAV